MRATDGLSGKSHSVSLGPGGAMIKPPPLLPSAINKASATGDNPCVHQSSVGWEAGGEWRQCADWRPKGRCLSSQVGMASGGCRVDSVVERANTPTSEGWRRKAGTEPSKIVCNRRRRHTRPPPRRRNGGGIKRRARRRAQSIAPVTAAVFSRMRRNAEPRPKMLGLGRT